MTDETVDTTDGAEDWLPGLVIDDSARDPSSRVWYALPDSYMDIPLAALDPQPETEADQQFQQVAGQVLGAVPEEARHTYGNALLDVRNMARYMQGEGIIGCSIGMHRADDESSAVSVFTVALREIEWAPPKVTALRAVSLRESPTNIGILTLTGGNPASVSETLVPDFTATGLSPQDLYQCNVYVPDPAGAQLAILTLTTTAVSTRRHYRELMEGIAYTVSFEDPMPEIERVARGEDTDEYLSSIKDDISADFG